MEIAGYYIKINDLTFSELLFAYNILMNEKKLKQASLNNKK